MGLNPWPWKKEPAVRCCCGHVLEAHSRGWLAYLRCAVWGCSCRRWHPVGVANR